MISKDFTFLFQNLLLIFKTNKSGHETDKNKIQTFKIIRIEEYTNDTENLFHREIIDTLLGEIEIIW